MAETQMDRARSQTTCMHVPFKGEGGPPLVLMCQKCYHFWLGAVAEEAAFSTSKELERGGRLMSNR